MVTDDYGRRIRPGRSDIVERKRTCSPSKRRPFPVGKHFARLPGTPVRNDLSVGRCSRPLVDTGDRFRQRLNPPGRQ